MRQEERVPVQMIPRDHSKKPKGPGRLIEVSLCCILLAEKLVEMLSPLFG